MKVLLKISIIVTILLLVASAEPSINQNKNIEAKTTKPRVPTKPATIEAPEDESKDSTETEVTEETKPESDKVIGNEEEDETEEEKTAKMQKQLLELNEKTKQAFENAFDISEDYSWTDID
jgi:hypothetical protein